METQPLFGSNIGNGTKSRSKTLFVPRNNFKGKVNINALDENINFLKSSSLPEIKINGYIAPCEKFLYKNYLLNTNTKSIETIMSKIEFGSNSTDICSLVFKTIFDDKDGKNEIEILKKIKGIPNTIQLIDDFKIDNKHVLVFPKLRKFNYKKLDLFDIVLYMKQLLSIVKNLNKIKLVHMDIKLDNLMLDFNNNLILIDFGLAKQYKSLTSALTVSGTSGYIAPELLYGEEVMNNKIDVYSCGCVFSQLLHHYISGCDLNYFGSSMFNISTLNEILEKLDDFINEKNSIRNKIIYEVAEFLKGLLNPNPFNRSTASFLLKNKLFLKDVSYFQNTDYNSIKLINENILKFRHLYNNDDDGYSSNYF